MTKEYLKSLIDEVSAIEVKSETQQTAKYELIEYVEELENQNKKLKEKLKILTGVEYRQLDEHTFVGIDYFIQRGDKLQRKINKTASQIEEAKEFWRELKLDNSKIAINHFNKFLKTLGDDA